MIATTTSRSPDPAGLALGSHPQRKILFASAHCIVDFSSGAAVATLDVLGGLTAAGFACQAFCTSKLDFPQEVTVEKILDDLGEPYQVRGSASGGRRARILSTRRHQVPITIVRLESPHQVRQPAEEIHAVLAFFRKFLEIDLPDVMLTYGGDAVTLGMIALAKRRRIPVVFAIHNFSYTGVESFRGVDYCIVPSEFTRRYYREQLGLDCQVLPNPVGWDRVRVEDGDTRLMGVVDPLPEESAEPLTGPGDLRSGAGRGLETRAQRGGETRAQRGGETRARRRFVTFVNPLPEKGVYPFVRIAQELGRRRPEIPLLVVEGRGTQQVLAACGLGRDAPVNVQIMANTSDPRQFWRQTRIALMPSLWWESQGLVAVEAMINGIPIIGSDRGSLPETLGEGGVLLPLPERLTPLTRVVPTAEEVEPWVETIIRLWDDRAFYEEQSLRGLKEARRWDPDRLRPLYAEFFGKVQLQAGPPFVGEDVAERLAASSGSEIPAGSLRAVVASPVPGARSASSRRAELGDAGQSYPGDPAAVTAALWRTVPDRARRVLEVRWSGSELDAAALERVQGQGESASSPWRRIGAGTVDIATAELVAPMAMGFDVILADQVLEYAADPATWLRRIRSLLAPEGVLVVAAGNDDYFSLLGRFPGGQSHDEPPRRLFSTATLTRMFREAELDSELIGTVAAPHAHGPAPRDPSASGSTADRAGSNPAPIAFSLLISHFIVQARNGELRGREIAINADERGGEGMLLGVGRTAE